MLSWTSTKFSLRHPTHIRYWRQLLYAHSSSTHSPTPHASQDQTVKIAEARDLEHELQRYREENAELKKRVSETSNIEAAKKKVDSKLEQLEAKVRRLVHTCDCIAC